MEDAVRRAGRGDAEAFETIVQPELADLRRLATAVVLDREVADDVVQDSLLAAWRGIGRLRDPAYFRTWLRRIVINRARNALRRPRTLRLVEAVRASDPHNLDDPSGEWSDAIAVETAMRGLSPDLRVCAALYYLRASTGRRHRRTPRGTGRHGEIPAARRPRAVARGPPMTPREDFPDRDEVDRRIERGLRRLTEPTAEALAVRNLLTPARAGNRRWTGWRVVVAAAASITIAVGAVFSLQALRGAPSAFPSSTTDAITRSTAPSGGEPAVPEEPAEVDVAAWVEAAWPAVIPGRFATFDSTAYERDPGTTLGHAPAVAGSFVEQRGGGPAVTTYAFVADPRALADSTQLIVRGWPLAFSRPHFNSGDGSFWETELIGVRDGVNASANPQRDVLFRVDEVLGTTLPGGFEPGLVQFTVQAGQVVVDVPRDVPYAEGYGNHVLGSGRYLFREQPAADLRLGEEVVLFLRYGGWLGLYGDRYGEVRALGPAHELYYAFGVEDQATRNLSAGGPLGDQWNPSLAELREIAATLSPRADQPLPDARIHPARPPHDANERPLPSPTPCSPLAIIDYWSGYASLDGLLADSDLVVVGRPTTRAREDATFSDALVMLANDVLVEQVVSGDASPGSLLPVARLAARDPACGLVIDGNEPLQIDRPYLMALRRDGDAFVLPEAPLALAEVRDGRLTSSRWPELNGLTIAAARERLAPTVLGGVEGLKADLRAAGGTAVDLGTFGGMPFSGRGVRLCVDEQKVAVYVYDSVQERVADAALIDPDDPSHVGRASVAWAGAPVFWQRDRIIVLYLGGDDATQELLTALLGQPFAQGRGRDPGPFEASC